MNSVITVFGRTIPLYGLCFYIGIIVSAVIALVFLVKKREVDRFYLAGTGIYAMIGAIVGSKLLFILLSWRKIVELNLGFESVIKGGFVFYGGLIGGILGLLIYGKQFKMNIMPMAEIYAVVLPLGHSFGRVGCYFGGCCYGMKYNGFPSVVYHSTYGDTPLETPLLAIQLIEAAGLFLLFFVMLAVFIKAKKEYTSILCYIIVYSVMRFILEFFRGDKVRGHFWALSTSQWISVLLFVSCCIFIVVKKKNRAAA